MRRLLCRTPVWNVTIYEASQRIGGRIHSDATTWADGQVSEWCGEFIDADHVTIHQLIQRFGLHTTYLRSGRMELSRSVMYFNHRYYRAEELAEDLRVCTPLLDNSPVQRVSNYLRALYSRRCTARSSQCGGVDRAARPWWAYGTLGATVGCGLHRILRTG